MIIGVIGAMDVEVDTLKEKMVDIEIIKKNHLVFFKGLLHGKKTVLVQSGVGKVNAGVCTQILITYFNVTKIINTGIAGGLGKELAVMDMVVSTDAMYHDMDATAFGYEYGRVPGIDVTAFPSNKEMKDIVIKVYNEGKTNGILQKRIHEGRIATGDVFVSSCEDKKDIIAKTNGICVEMEGAAIAQICYLNNINYIIIRCISDLAEATDEVYLEKEAALESAFVTENVIKQL